MKRVITYMGMALLCLSLGAQAAKPPKKANRIPEVKTYADSVAYAMGLAYGNSYLRNTSSMPGDSIDRMLVGRGFTELIINEPLFSEEHGREMLETYFKNVQEKVLNERGQKNEKFLQEYRNKANVKATESGLLYKRLRPGRGVKPTVQDTVVVNYVGRTIEGEEFDSSFKRNEPATFSLLRVIPGWTEGLCLMEQGSKYELVVPAELAYGDRGAGQMVKPRSVLVFEIELLEVKPFVEKETAKEETTKLTNEGTFKPSEQAKPKGKGAKKTTK